MYSSEQLPFRFREAQYCEWRHRTIIERHFSDRRGTEGNLLVKRTYLRPLSRKTFRNLSRYFGIDTPQKCPNTHTLPVPMKNMSPALVTKAACLYHQASNSQLVRCVLLMPEYRNSPLLSNSNLHGCALGVSAYMLPGSCSEHTNSALTVLLPILVSRKVTPTLSVTQEVLRK